MSLLPFYLHVPCLYVLVSEISSFTSDELALLNPEWGKSQCSITYGKTEFLGREIHFNFDLFYSARKCTCNTC